MHTLVIDAETRGILDLTDVGAHRYAADDRTEVLCVGYALDDEPVKLWLPGEPVPDEFVFAANDSSCLVVAHNVRFERSLFHYILTPMHHFPEFPLEQWRCLMAMSMAVALPAKLENAAKALHLDNQKDLSGHRTMLQISKPRRARKEEDPNEIHWFGDNERMQRLYEYCKQDVETERELYNMLPPLSDAEQELWLLDQCINDRGFHVDRELANAAQKIIEVAALRINEEMSKITDGGVTSIAQIEALMTWLRKNNCHIDDLNKKTIEVWLKRSDLSTKVRHALELRTAGAQAAAKKVDALLSRVEPDDRIRGSLIYHAAGTGRWASWGFQVHNAKRNPYEDKEELDCALDVISSGDYDHARKLYDNPLAVIGNCIRAMINAAPGMKLVGADFSGIEARITAWLADETSKLEVFRRFDESGAFVDNPYVIAAARIFKKPVAEIAKASIEYQGGKGAELALGFGGGSKAYKKFVPEGIFDDEQVARIVDTWRAAHPNVQRFWGAINRAVWAAVKEQGATLQCGRILLHHDGEFLWLTLPSGRKLAYPHCRIERVSIIGDRKLIGTATGYPGVVYKDNSAGQWRDATTWHGLWVENIVQAIARDLLAAAIIRIEASGYPIVVHVHDSATVEVPENSNVLGHFIALMTTIPNWAEGLPITVKAEESQRLT